MTIDLSNLNENQLDAVNWDSGSMLVLAGPGSGKTRVLTYRIAKILEATEGKYFKILALTFTNKAAAEMRERVEELVTRASERVLLTTFHAFCADILRQHGSHIGLRPDYSILSQKADREGVLEDAIKCVEEETGYLDFASPKLLIVINQLLDNAIEPDDVVSRLKGRLHSNEISLIYRKYRELLIQNNFMDFGSLLAETLSLLKSKPGIQKQLNKIYPYVCVDEFQDTNHIQYEILKLLVHPKQNNIFIVADDDQILYQWNGASPDRLNQLYDDYGISIIQLPENYRCPPEVIEIANILIDHNQNRFANKPKNNLDPIRLLNFDTHLDELNFVAKDIVSRPQDERKNCVILSRTNKPLTNMLDALDNCGLHGFLASRKDEFISAPMMWLHSSLRLANLSEDKDQLRKMCEAFYRLEGINIDPANVRSRAVLLKSNYILAWVEETKERKDVLSPLTKQYIDRAVFNLAERLDFWGFIEATFKWVENLEPSPDGEEHFTDFSEEESVWHHLENDIISKYLGKENVTLSTLLQEFDLNSKTPSPPKGAIPCYTVHASKGMEFDHVYLIGMVEDNLPSWSAVKKGIDSQEMMEERRNCFVAITRTQKSLTLTYSAELNGWPKKPSRFLYEMELL